MTSTITTVASYWEQDKHYNAVYTESHGSLESKEVYRCKSITIRSSTTQRQTVTKTTQMHECVITASVIIHTYRFKPSANCTSGRKGIPHTVIANPKPAAVIHIYTIQ
jgi:hypothetical protein